MSAPTRPRRTYLGISVAWGYALGFLLMAVVLLLLMPEPQGPSPWDPVAFRKGLLELFANFRILDELADLGVVRVADIGEGFLNVDLDLIAVSNRKFGVAPFYLALILVSLSLLLRAFRQRLLAGHFGLPAGARGQMGSWFYGRGMNLFFPFGPVDLAIARTLDRGTRTGDAAAAVVFYNRVFELLAILGGLLVGLVLLGWGGAVTAVLWTVILVAAGVSLTRPLGWAGPGGQEPRWNVFRHVWASFEGPSLLGAVRYLVTRPGMFGGVLMLSGTALLLEITGYWAIKQAFSSPMDDYVLMKSLPFLNFAVVVLGASITRIIPYTFASFGIYEITSVIMFWVQGEGFLSATTVTLLDSTLMNGLTLVFFLAASRLTRYPSMLETWRSFFRESSLRVPG